MGAVFSADDILYATNGRLVSGSINNDRGRLVWSLEEIQPGDWFISMPSRHEGGHGALESALSRGARGCIVNRRSRYDTGCESAPLIAVSDTNAAIFDLVRHWRYLVRPTVVGVSGSNGRRSTLVLMHEFLKDAFNCHVAFMTNLGPLGCVQDVLSMPEDTTMLLFEAGAIERGDVARIGGVLDPDLAVITQIRHPIPLLERDEHMADLYCELLETIGAQREPFVKAVVYDKSASVKERSRKLLKQLPAIYFSESDSTSVNRVSEREMNLLSATMQKTICQPVTRAELWCAVEAAKALGIDPEQIAEFFDDEDAAEAASIR